MNAICLLACLAAAAPAQAEGIPAIALKQDFQAARASTADPTGGNKDAYPIPAGKTVTLADITGPGVIRHIWMTIPSSTDDYLSKLIFEIRWDDADEPAVRSPLGPFFGLGHNQCADVVSEMIVVMKAAVSSKDPPGQAAYNCYFPMPFRKRAVVTVTNTSAEDIRTIHCHVDYQKHSCLPADAMYFHAQYRSEMTTPAKSPGRLHLDDKNNYIILETSGAGHYIGCTLHIEAHENEAGKWYEGDECIVVDGDMANAIRGTGSEDYFNMAWGIRRWFQAPLFGTSYHAWNEGERELRHWGRFSVYRWHVPDPIPFTQSIRVSIEHGHDNDAANRYASVGYWYADAPTPSQARP